MSLNLTDDKRRLKREVSFGGRRQVGFVMGFPNLAEFARQPLYSLLCKVMLGFSIQKIAVVVGHVEVYGVLYTIRFFTGRPAMQPRKVGT